MPRPVVPIAPLPRAASSSVVERQMVRHHQVRPLADEQVLASSTPRAPSASISSSRIARVERHARPDHAEVCGLKIPAGTRCRANLPWGLTTVWPALSPPWARITTCGLPGQQVDDLALALVAPLAADDGDNRHPRPHAAIADLPRSREYAPDRSCSAIGGRLGNQAARRRASCSCGGTTRWYSPDLSFGHHQSSLSTYQRTVASSAASKSYAGRQPSASRSLVVSTQ